VILCWIWITSRISEIITENWTLKKQSQPLHLPLVALSLKEVFASIPDHVIVIKLSSDHKNALNFTAKFNSELKKNIRLLMPILYRWMGFLPH
jgi:hypothetical protein